MELNTSPNSHSNGATHGPKRSTFIYNSAELAVYPHLKSLVDFLDGVFAHTNTTKYGCKQIFTTLRFETGPQQLIRELGPNGFFIFVTEEHFVGTGDSVDFVAAGGAKMYEVPKEGTTYGSATNMLFKRAPKQPGAADAIDMGDNDSHGHSKWELLSFATDIKRQGQGLAGQLYELVLAEIRRRVDSRHANRNDEGGNNTDETSTATVIQPDVKPKIMLLLSTLQEVNEAYYRKRGWTTTSVRQIPAGAAGNLDSFGIVEMMKSID